MRETLKSPRAWSLGEVPDDGVDAVYGSAGEAFDKLGEPLGEIWETAAQRSTRLLTEDIMREAEAIKKEGVAPDSALALLGLDRRANICS
jgi:hypothetical protein